MNPLLILVRSDYYFCFWRHLHLATRLPYTMWATNVISLYANRVLLVLSFGSVNLSVQRCLVIHRY